MNKERTNKLSIEEVINGLQALRRKATVKEAEYLEIAASCVYAIGELKDMVEIVTEGRS